MRNKKGFTLVEVISAIVILSIIITLGVFSITKVRSNILEKQYKNIKLEIELAAEKYYSDTESKEVYVDTLIKEGYLKADNKSMTITDSRDKTILNCYIVTINDDEKGSLGIENNVLENGKCNENVVVNSEISIVGEDGNKINKTWYKNPITLKAKFKDTEKDPNNYSYTWKSEKNPNIITDEKTYNLEETYKERGKVIDDEFYVTLVNGDEILESKGQRVRIDGVLPEIKTLEIPDKENWTKDKTLKVNATDVGSGIESYILSMGDCESIPLEKYNKIPDVQNPNDVKIEQKITKNGTYTFCVSDKAGNKVKYEETIIIEKIDDIPPVCSYIENTKWTKSNVAISFGCVDNESGCAKLTYKNATTNCTGTSCYKTYTYTNTYKAANISSTIGTFTIEDNAGNKVICPSDKKEVNVYLDKDKPVISNINISSNQLNYNSRYTKVSFTLTDNHSGISSFCIGISKNNCNTKNINSYCTQNGNRYDCSVDYTFTSSDGSGNTEYVYITAYDNVKNSSTQSKRYDLYKECTDTDFERYDVCSKKCDGGVYYEYRKDSHLGTSCYILGNNPCNTMSCCSWTRKELDYTGSCDESCGSGKKIRYYRLYSNYNDSYCGQDYDYIGCYEDYGCYVPPDPTPDPNPGGGGGSSCKPSTINGNRCDTTHDILYYISTCCGGECNYSAKAGNVEYGTISQSLLQGASKCSSYGEPPAPSKPACYYVNVGCAGNGHDYGTKNCTCGHGYGGYQCGCKCPRGCVE